jgi:arginine decarboxylase
MARDAWQTPGRSSGDSLRGSPWAAEFHEFRKTLFERFSIQVEKSTFNTVALLTIGTARSSHTPCVRVMTHAEERSHRAR